MEGDKMASLAPCRSSSRRGEARYQTFEGRRAAWQSKSQSTAAASGAAVPFQEVISEATAAVEAEAEGEGEGSPDFTAKRDPAASLPPFDQKFLVFFWICLLHGKVSLVGKKSVFQFYSMQAGAATVPLGKVC